MIGGSNLYNDLFIKDLEEFLCKVNTKIRKKTHGRTSKNIGCIPLLRGDNYNVRKHFHLVLNKPHFLSQAEFESIIKLFWKHGRVSFHDIDSNYWDQDALNQYSNDFFLESNIDTLVIECLNVEK